MPDETCELVACFVCVRCCEECSCRDRKSATPSTDAYERKLKAQEKQRKIEEEQQRKMGEKQSYQKLGDLDDHGHPAPPPRGETMERSPLDTSEDVT